MGIPFQTLIWMRALGGYLFLLGGVIPIAWFMTSRAMSLKPAVTLSCADEVHALGEIKADVA